MSAEDRAAQRRIPDDQFNEILRVIRETVRAEMRAEREAANGVGVATLRARFVELEQAALASAQESLDFSGLGEEHSQGRAAGLRQAISVLESYADFEGRC